MNTLRVVAFDRGGSHFRISDYRLRALMWLLVLSSLLSTSAARSQTPSAQALAEICYLQTTFGVPLNRFNPTPGNYSLAANKSFTAAMLPGAQLQSDPPQLGTIPQYSADQVDGTTNPPYQSTNLQDFQFKYFNNTFNFSGYHTLPSVDYAAVHGFETLVAYARDSTAVTWLPAGTQWMKWAPGDIVNWNTFMEVLGLNAARWDQVMDLGETAVIQAIVSAGGLNKYDPTKINEFMIDMEHSALNPTTLRQQVWYPTNASASEQATFEKKYYDGFAMTEYAPVDAARQLGFKNISLYGWKPISANYWDLGTYAGYPTTDWYWQKVGIQVTQHVDSINNSVYSPYWSSQSVAFTLAQNDLNLKFVKSLPQSQQKPVRPYFSNQIFGGGGSWRWWRNQALATEEMRAIALLNGFTQYDGMVLWNFADLDFDHDQLPINNNLPPKLFDGVDVMFRDGTFAAIQEGGSVRTFARYDAIHVDTIDASGNVRFQLIDKTNGQNNYGVGTAFPYYDSTVTSLSQHLRATSEPLAAMFEGLAMAKLLEWNLRNDTQVVDFDPQQTFAQTLPILRHIKNGDLHIVATYDPQVVYGQSARNVTVNNFGGVSGLNLTFVADSQVRVYVVRVSAPT